MRIVYKAFEPGFVCRGVQFAPPGELNVTEAANCRKNGWHTAENPADCLSYYPDVNRSWYCLVGIGGDLHEDGNDSKIAATELTILRRLTLPDYFLHILIYMAKHPEEECCVAKAGRAVARNGYTVVRGKRPCAKGSDGDVLAMAREGEGGQIEQIAVFVVGADGIPADVYINIDGQAEEVKANGKAKSRRTRV